MRLVSRERICEIARATYDADLAYALEELLEYREGFAPAERLPEDATLAQYKVVPKSGRWRVGYYGDGVFYGEDGWYGEWEWKPEDVLRWYPIGGERWLR